jgi:hypothetical protein
MVRPATLDRVENGGSGSGINPRERKPKEPTRDNRALPARDYPVCRRAHGRQGRCAPLKRWPEDGPSLTAAARVGVGNLRSGQKKACGAVEQKKEPEQARKSARKSVSKKAKCLRSGWRLENEETALQSNQETDPERLYRLPGHSLTSSKPTPERPPLPIRPYPPNPKRTNDVLPKTDNLISYRQESKVRRVGQANKVRRVRQLGAGGVDHAYASRTRRLMPRSVNSADVEGGLSTRPQRAAARLRRYGQGCRRPSKPRYVPLAGS